MELYGIILMELQSLHSRKRRNRFSLAEFTMPNNVIEQVHRLAMTAEEHEWISTNINGSILIDQAFTMTKKKEAKITKYNK